MELNIIIPVPPSVNHLYINQYTWRKDKSGKAMRVPTGKRILSEKGKKYKEDVQQLVREQIKNQQWDYDKTANIYVYLDYVAFLNRKGRDTDNLHKLLQDTLKEIIYIDDSKVLTRPNRVLIDRENPRLEIKIKFVEYIGVFDNEKQRKLFVNKCDKCKRNSRVGNCSILNDCINGVINKDFNFEKKECNKIKI